MFKYLRNRGVFCFEAFQNFNWIPAFWVPMTLKHCLDFEGQFPYRVDEINVICSVEHKNRLCN